jgi:hypothetical protein
MWHHCPAKATAQMVNKACFLQQTMARPASITKQSDQQHFHLRWPFPGALLSRSNFYISVVICHKPDTHAVTLCAHKIPVTPFPPLFYTRTAKDFDLISTHLWTFNQKCSISLTLLLKLQDNWMVLQI